MSDEAPKNEEDWSAPLPAKIPRPTYAPAAMAFGLSFFLWGLVTSPVVIAAGFVVTVTALVSWIKEMRHGE